MSTDNKKSHILLFILSGILFCLTPTSYAQTVEPDHGDNLTSVTDSILTGSIDTSQISATSPDTVRFFRAAGKYALDEGTDSRYKRSVKLSKFYEPFGTDYVAPWKLVPTGKSNVVEAYAIESGSPYERGKLRFALKDGTEIPAKDEEGKWTLTLPGVGKGETYEVFALYETTKGKYATVGKLNVVSYPEQHYTVTLVEVDGQAPQAASLQDQLNGIFTLPHTFDVNPQGSGSKGFTANMIDYGEVAELTILRLMNALEVKDYPRSYQLLEADNNKLLSHLAGQMHDVSVYFWTDKKNYTNFIGELVAMFNSDNGATIALSGGTALATKVHWVRRAWALAEVAGAAGNIAVNTTSTSPELREVIDTYNLAMGLIGFKNIGKGVVNYTKELPNSTKQLLQKNEGLRSRLIAEYLNYRIAITKLKNSDNWSNLSAEVRQNIIRQEKAFISLADAKNLSNDNWGVPDDIFINGKTKQDILNIPKKERPTPNTYLSRSYINNHLNNFKTKASYLVTGDTYNKYIVPSSTVGRADGLFVSTTNDIDALLIRANGNIGIIELDLGIPIGSWQGKGGIYRIDIIEPEKYNLRIPCGNEAGANDLCLPGGKLPNGKLEAVTDPIPVSNIRASKIIN